MKPVPTSSALFSAAATNSLRLLAIFALLAACARSGVADDEFQDLVSQIPRSANAVVLLNMEKAKNSPLGQKEDFRGKLERAFAAGTARVPPQATRFVMASEIDFDFMEPLWEAAVMDLDEEMTLGPLAKARGGTLDTIEGLQAVSLPNDTYLVLLGPKRLAAMAPANRQEVVRWIRSVRKPSPPPLSPYLQKAAVYSDDAGSEIIMALDLDGAMSFERVAKYLKANEKQLDEWQSKDEHPQKLTEVASVLSNIEGIRIGVRIGEQQTSKIVVDMHADAFPVSSIAKPLLLQAMSDKGAMIEDFQSWTFQTKGSEISLAGILSDDGRRRLLSVIDSPIHEDTLVKAPSGSPGEMPEMTAEKSRAYFRTIVAMADDLKKDMKEVKNLASTQLFFDKYAKRIERMPILGVDEELLNYSAFVSNTLRQCTGSIKTMGIQSGVRTAQSGGGYGGDYGYGGYGYGYGGYGRGFVDPKSEVKAAAAEKRVIRAEEKSVAATDIQKLRQGLIATTNNVRRKMTLKYQIEF